MTLLAEQDHAVVLTDLRMKGMPGTELLAEIRRLYPDIGVILMTGFGSVDNAVEAMKRGASDYLTKPVKTSKDTVRGLIAAHGAHHVLQINLYKKKDYAQLEATWPMMREHAYLIADTLTTALVKQFPDKFS